MNKIITLSIIGLAAGLIAGYSYDYSHQTLDPGKGNVNLRTSELPVVRNYGLPVTTNPQGTLDGRRLQAGSTNVPTLGQPTVVTTFKVQ